MTPAMGEKLRWNMTLPNGEKLRWGMGPQYVWNGEVPDNPNPPSTMQQNDISITITPEAESAMLTKADEFLALLDAFAVSLDDDDRAAYFKLGEGRMAFDEKCDDYLHQRSDLRPDTVDLAEYDKDGAATAAAKRILAKVSTITTRLTDTLIVLGADRLSADLLFYHYLEFIARTGAAGADDIHDELRQLYPGGRRRTRPATGNPPTT